MRELLVGIGGGLLLLWSAGVAHSAELILRWHNNAVNAAGLHIERKAGRCHDSSKVWQSLTTLPAHTVEYVDRSVVAGMTYCYRVQAYNAGGFSGPSNFAEGVAKERLVQNAPERIAGSR